MRLGHLILLSAVVSLSVTTNGCGHKPRLIEAPMTNARLVGNVYTNSFHALAITIPSGWFVLNHDAINQATDAPPKPPQTVQNPFTGEVSEVPDVELYNLLTLVEQTNVFPDATLTALGTTNMSFSIFSQDVSPVKAHTGKNFLGMLYNILQITSEDNEPVVTDGPKEVDLNGQKFYRDTFRQRQKGIMASHRIYARVIEHRALAFVLTAPTDGELEKLEPILRTLQFH